MSVKGTSDSGPAIGPEPMREPELTAATRRNAFEEHEGDHAKLRRATDADDSGLMSYLPDGVSNRLRMAGLALDALEMRGEAKANDLFGDGDSLAHSVGQTGTVLTVVTLGITILIGILIYGQIDSSLPSPSNSDLQNASENSTGTFSDAMELAPVIMIVLLAAVVLAVVQRFR